MKPAPASLDEFIAELVAIFPDFAKRIEPLENDEELSYHSLLLFVFNPFFAKHIEEFTPKQLKRFAELVVRCVNAPGPVENALDTCFLEHTRQMKVNKQLNAYLREARRAYDRGLAKG